MTDRAAVIARIADRIQFLTAADPASFAHDKPLMGQRVGATVIGSIDIAEIEVDIEDEFALNAGTLDDLPIDWTIDVIADAVMAAKQSEKA